MGKPASSQFTFHPLPQLPLCGAPIVRSHLPPAQIVGTRVFAFRDKNAERLRGSNRFGVTESLRRGRVLSEFDFRHPLLPIFQGSQDRSILPALALEPRLQFPFFLLSGGSHHASPYSEMFFSGRNRSLFVPASELSVCPYRCWPSSRFRCAKLVFFSAVRHHGPPRSVASRGMPVTS